MSTVKISEYTGTGSFGYVSSSGKLFAGIAQDSDQSGTNVVVYNPTSGEFEYTGSYIGSDSVLATASHAITASYLNQPLTEFSSSNISIDGFPDLSASLAGVTTPATASYAVSASLATSASYAANAGLSNNSISSVNASNASSVYLQEVNNNFGYGLVFRGSTGIGYQQIYADATEYSPTYNPSTNTLSSAYINASSDLDVGGTLSINGYPDVSASLADLSTPETASYALTASYVANAVSSSYVVSSSYAVSASHAYNSALATTALNSAFANVATQTIVSNTNNNLNYGLVFKSGDSDGANSLFADSENASPSYNPSTNTLSAAYISASATITGNDIVANSTLTMDGNLTINNGNQLVNSDDKAVININANDFSLGESDYPLTINTNLTSSGNISSSGVLSIPGFPDVSASLAAAGGGGFTPSLSTDITARNITASGDISSSGDLYANDVYLYGNQFTDFFNGPAATPAVPSPSFAIGSTGDGSLYMNQSIAQQVRIISDTGTATHKPALSWSSGLLIGSYGTDATKINGTAIQLTGNANSSFTTVGSGDITITAADDFIVTADAVDINGPITASGDISASGDITARSGSFQYITASVIEVDAETIYIGGTPLSKTDVDNLKSGKTITTSSKGGFNNYVEASAFISSIDNNVFMRTNTDRISFDAGNGYILDLNGNTNKVVITGSLDILAASPAITMTGDIHQAKGGYLIKDTSSVVPNILQYDDNFGIADYAESVSDYNLYNQHNFQLAARGRISGSFGMTQGFHNSATFFSFAHGRNTSCKPPVNNIGHWPQGSTSNFGDSLSLDPINNVSGLNYGLAAHSEGRSTQANVPYSHAEGFECVTTGSSAGGNHAEGYRTTAEGNYAHSEGTTTLAQGLGSHAEGFSTVTVGESSHAEGIGTIASGAYQHVQGRYNTHDNTTSLMVIGNGTDDSTRSDLALFNVSSSIVFQGSLNIQNTVTSNTAEGDYSLAHGILTHASGAHSHAEGTSTLAQGRTSHAEGYYATASGDNSHAEGSKTIASGRYSHAEGIESSAIGEGSHAQGYKNAANGVWSQVAGSGSKSQNTGSFVTGEGLESQKDFQTVIGAFNNLGNTGIDDIEEAYFVVGIGTGGGDRKNALTVNTGSVFINTSILPTSDPGVAGQLYTTGSDYFGAPAGKKVLMIS